MLYSAKISHMASPESDRREKTSRSLNGMLKRLEGIQVQFPGSEPFSLVDLHKLRGVYPGKVYDSHNSPYNTSQKYRGGGHHEWITWGKVPHHSLAATLVTDVLGEALELDTEYRANVNLAAWLHDSNKKTERNLQRAIERGEPVISGSLRERTVNLIFESRKKSLTVKALELASIQEEEENSEYGIPPFITDLMRQNNPPSANGHETIEGRIMWLADAVLTGTKIESVKARMDRSENHPIHQERNRAYSESFVPKYGRPLFDVQRDLGDRYVDQFSDLIGIKPEEFYDWLEQKVNERIKKGQLPIFPSVEGTT